MSFTLVLVGDLCLVDERLHELQDVEHRQGREVAAFTIDEERAAGSAEVVPFLLADELVRRGATHRPAPDWQAQVVTDVRLVTGQNPASATGVAEAVVALLGRD